VIVENVFLLAKQYDFEQKQLEEERKKKAFIELKALFYAVSADGVSIDFEHFWQKAVMASTKLGARFRKRFQDLGYRGRDLLAVRDLLVDPDDPAAEVDVELYCYMLRKINDEAVAQDILVLQKVIGDLENLLSTLELECNGLLDKLDDLFWQLQAVERDLNVVVESTERMDTALGVCVKSLTRRREVVQYYEVQVEESLKKRRAAQLAMRLPTHKEEDNESGDEGGDGDSSDDGDVGGGGVGGWNMTSLDTEKT